jgi:hypothetical protein
MANFLELRLGGVRRIILLRTPLNSLADVPGLDRWHHVPGGKGCLVGTRTRGKEEPCCEHRYASCWV